MSVDIGSFFVVRMHVGGAAVLPLSLLFPLLSTTAVKSCCIPSKLTKAIGICMINSLCHNLLVTPKSDTEMKDAFKCLSLPLFQLLRPEPRRLPPFFSLALLRFNIIKKQAPQNKDINGVSHIDRPA